MANNDFHNNTLCVMILAYNPNYTEIKLVLGDSPPEMFRRLMKSIPGVIDFVATKDSEKEGKYFFLVESHKFGSTESDIATVIGTLNTRLKNPADPKEHLLKFQIYPYLKSGVSAGGFIVHSAAGFANLFNNESLTPSSIRSTQMNKMSFRIDNAFPPLKTPKVAWNKNDDDTLMSLKSTKSARTEKSRMDTTEVLMALTMEMFETKMTETLTQFCAEDLQKRKAERAEDRAREDRMLVAANSRQEQERIDDRAREEQMLTMICTMLQNNSTVQVPVAQITQPESQSQEEAGNTKRAHLGVEQVMDVVQKLDLDHPPPKGGQQ